MENRRAIHKHRDKIKNTHATYKPGKGEREQRIKDGKKLGRRRGIVGDIEPAKRTKAAKTVVTPVCVICSYPFLAPAVICPNCGNCQACGKYSEDRYSNHCRQCGNQVAGPRLDADIPSVGAP